MPSLEINNEVTSSNEDSHGLDPKVPDESAKLYMTTTTIQSFLSNNIPITPSEGTIRISTFVGKSPVDMFSCTMFVPAPLHQYENEYNETYSSE